MTNVWALVAIRLCGDALVSISEVALPRGWLLAEFFLAGQPFHSAIYIYIYRPAQLGHLSVDRRNEYMATVTATVGEAKYTVSRRK